MKKTIVKIGLVQMKCGPDAKTNLEKAISGINETAKKGANIVCLPELFLSKYFCQEKNAKNFKLAEAIPGPTTKTLGGLAKKTKTTIICSLFEKAKNGKFFNSIAVIGEDCEVSGVYRKMHIPSIPPDLYAENYYFEKGDLGFKTFKTPHAKIAPMICYDQWFPEGARIAAVNGAQILFYPTAIGWPTYAKATVGKPPTNRKEINRAEHEAWQIIQRSHSIANNVFVVAVNRVGLEGNLKFWGTSFVSDPYGRILAKASTDKEENLVVECDLSVIDRMREEWPFLEERRVKSEKAL